MREIYEVKQMKHESNIRATIGMLDREVPSSSGEGLSSMKGAPDAHDSKVKSRMSEADV